MRKIVTTVAVMALTGCVSAPELDLSKADSACSQRCSSEYSACTSGFKFFPLVAQAHCNESLKVCAATCAPSQSVTASTAASPAQKLSDLSNLYKQGLITEKEYEAKRQEILKTL
jgi:hypothetical protein